MDESTFAWSDDEEDENVENLVKLINEGHIFSSEMFVGGATKADVIRMRKEAEEKNAKQKAKKGCSIWKKFPIFGDGDGNSSSDNSVHHIAELVACKIKKELVGLSEMVSSCSKNIEELRTKL